MFKDMIKEAPGNLHFIAGSCKHSNEKEGGDFEQMDNYYLLRASTPLSS
jgi:hypothetical protein